MRWLADEPEGGPELTVCRGCGRRFWSTKAPWCQACMDRELDELRQGDEVVCDDGQPDEEPPNLSHDPAVFNRGGGE